MNKQHKYQHEDVILHLDLIALIIAIGFNFSWVGISLLVVLLAGQYIYTVKSKMEWEKDCDKRGDVK